MRFKLIILLGVIAIAVLGAGCGGGSDSTSATQTAEADGGKATTTKNEAGEAKGEARKANEGADKAKGEADGTKSQAGEAPSRRSAKTKFKIRINELCIEVPPAYEEELEQLEKGGKKLTSAEKKLKAAVPPLYDTIEAMEETEPPPGEEQVLQEMIDALEAAAKGVEADPTSKLSGPDSPFAEFQALSKKFGFGTCEGL